MIKKFVKNALLPSGIILTTLVSFVVISSTANRDGASNKVDVKSTNITSTSLESLSVDVQLKGYGEIVPVEVSALSTRVSGTVESWSESFVRGQIVKRGDELFRLEDSRYRSELKQAKAALMSAKAELEQELGLAKVAKSELERINSTQKNRLFLREPQIQSAYAAEQSAQAQVTLAQTNLDSTVIKAPFDGLIVERNLGLGQFINAGSPVATLYNVNRAEVLVPLAKFDSQFLPPNMGDQQVTVRLPNTQAAAQGRLSRQLKLTDSQSRTNSVIVTIENLYQSQLQFGDYVEVSFSGQRLDEVFKVPESLVSNNQVWVVNNKSELEQREVVIARHQNGFAIVKGNFKTTDKLATVLPEYPYQGMPVKVVLATSSDSAKERL